MTTAAVVAGRPLSDWSRDTRWGTWYALWPESADAPPLGALRIDRALLTPQGARERLASAVLAVGRLRLPGVPATVDLVAEAGEVWLITARPLVPTLADLLAAEGPRPDAGSVASVLNETAQTLLALHATRLAHGSLTVDNVVLAPDGTALLAESALGIALGDDMPSASAQRADIAAWAAVARTLGDAWAAAGTPEADLFARCATTAESDGLVAARAILVAGREVLPADFLRRTALRAAAAAASADLTPPVTRDAPPAVGDTAGETPTAPSPETVVPGRDDHVGFPAVPDTQLTVPGRADRVPRPAAPDEQATVLGKRNRTSDAFRAPATEGDGDGDILLRFGPGVPADEQETLRALWRAAAPAPARERRRRRAWFGATVVLTALAVVVWLLLLRPTAGPTVTAAEVQAPTRQLHCGQTADVIGVLTTDGRRGPVAYRWLRSDGHDSGELIHTARRGDRSLTVHLRWTVRGSGSFQGTARLQVLHRSGSDSGSAPIEAEGSFRYSCP
ncbi:hypothetical protein [Streptomyces sp. NBC_01236]|uniref:hypothetical protein n=1 Tax=Streptomyces sp. NBC_01236 TaxID=2903789 RepID=UPI002E14AB43|nr:hypothetical protein OG324_42175 [Streptomyces sp. NBC_01236]